MNKDNLFVALVFYRLGWCGLFGQNTIFGGEIGICLSKIHPSFFSSGIYDGMFIHTFVRS